MSTLGSEKKTFFSKKSWTKTTITLRLLMPRKVIGHPGSVENVELWDNNAVFIQNPTQISRTIQS